MSNMRVTSEAVLLKWKDRFREEWDEDVIDISFEDYDGMLLLNIDNKTSLKVDTDLLKRVITFFGEEDL